MELEKHDEFESNETKPGNIGDSPSSTFVRLSAHDEVRVNPIEHDSQLDLRPEFCQHRDEGCELAGSCLNCPFIKCIYDEPGGKQRWMQRLRAKEIARLHTTECKKVKELAEMFGISQRTVQRVLKAARGNSNGTQSHK